MSDINKKKKTSDKRKASPNEELLENIHISSQENTLIKSLDKFCKRNINNKPISKKFFRPKLA